MNVINSSVPAFFKSAQTGHYVNKAWALESYRLGAKEAAETQKKSDDAGALLDHFYFVLGEAFQKKPTLLPLRLTTQALSKFSDEDKRKVHSLLMASDTQLKPLEMLSARRQQWI